MESIKNPIEKLITDYETDNLKEILITDLMNYISPKYKKVNIYNNKKQNPLQKIWLKVPKVKVFNTLFSLSNLQKNTLPLKILLVPNVGKIKKFYLFIKKLEKIISSKLRNVTNERMMMKSSTKMEEKFQMNTMKLNLPCKKYNNSYKLSFNISISHTSLFIN